MAINVNVRLIGLDRVGHGLARIEQLLLTILGREDKMGTVIDEVLEKVRDQSTVISSVKTLLETLSAKLEEAGTDPAKLAEIKSLVAANTEDLSKAVVENTPSVEEDADEEDGEEGPVE